MRTINIITYLLAATISTAASAYEAHEWGTFTSLVGSDGRSLNGMYHEDEPLPSFVYKFGETRRPPYPPPRPPPDDGCIGKGCFGRNTIDANIITQKMETPVIYFYANANETPLNIDVNVRFPEGVVTESYPGPVSTSPQRSDNLVLANGNTTYSIQVLNQQNGLLPFVEPGNIYGHARNVASNIISSGREMEKFIFYRGLGRFQPRIQISSQYGNLSVQTTRTSAPQAIFAVNVNSQQVAYGMRLNRVGQTLSRAEIQMLRDPGLSRTVMAARELRSALINELIFAGLRSDEANAMLDTWEAGYLKVPGLRLLYILPRHEVDNVLPVTLSPAPSNFARAFVARIEVMLDTDEEQLVREIDRLQEEFQIESLGRFAEPMLRRAREVAAVMTKLNQNTRPLIERLIVRAAQ